MSASGARLRFYPERGGSAAKFRRLDPRVAFFWLEADIVCGKCAKNIPISDGLEAPCRYCGSPLFTEEEVGAMMSMVQLGTTMAGLEHFTDRGGE